MFGVHTTWWTPEGRNIDLRLDQLIENLLKLPWSTSMNVIWLLWIEFVLNVAGVKILVLKHPWRVIAPLILEQLVLWSFKA